MSFRGAINTQKKSTLNCSDRYCDLHDDKTRNRKNAVRTYTVCSNSIFSAKIYDIFYHFPLFMRSIDVRLLNLLRATRGAHNPNLQVVITHASHVCSQLSFGLPLRMNGMHRTQFDDARLDRLSLVIR